MLARFLDASYPVEVRRHITLVTTARICANACYRFAAPFLATIASGLGVSLSTLGVAVAVAEVAGLTSPVIGHRIESWQRRTAMATGLGGIALGASIAALAPHVALFAVGLMVLGTSKIAFDLGIGAWVADHVPFARRGRVVGLTETSWALGLLLGVSALAIVVAFAGWRWAYATGAGFVVVMSALIRARLPLPPVSPRLRSEEDEPPSDGGPVQAGGAGHVASVLLAMFTLMAGSQFAFVTFGSWLEDEHGFGAGGLAAVAFGLGSLELVASTMSAHHVDTWGKQRSVALGAAIMVPSGLALAATSGLAPLGLVALGFYLFAFEFAIVSALPLGTNLVPGAPARGLGLLLAAGTLGRALASVPATRWYERHGIGWPAVAGAACASLTVIAILHHPQSRSLRRVTVGDR